MTARILTLPRLALLIPMLISGCGDSSVHNEQTASDMVTSNVGKIRIHIDGFKKSKSGAT